MDCRPRCCADSRASRAAPSRLLPPAGIAGAAVVFGADRLGENDRALVAQLFDEQMVARRKVDVVGRVAAAGRTHVLGVERILEGKHHAIHRHLVEVGFAAVARVEFGRAFQRIGQVSELLAHRGAPLGNGPSDGCRS